MSEHPPDESTCDHELLSELAEDFAARYRRGEQPSIEDYAHRHPILAGEIRETFPALMAMENPSFGLTADYAPATERLGSVIGRYRLLEHLGEGGFGVVFMAEQQFPVRRKVALKLIKPGVDTRQVIARFEAERQALALMEHENIARVLDAGATESGRPYFVMELVRGVPITQYCDQNRLAPKARLELFVQVCRAVQHAHTKGVIHRDIKPTNVLVTLHDGVPVPKVIDFGVAKATGQQLTEKTLFTQFAQIVGTPLYMSPEQAEMSGLDVDTRSDVYSLGVLLYELLTGTTPVDKERLRQAAFDEVIRIIREEEPPKPSTRLSTPGAPGLPSIAANRGLEPKKLSGLMRGELDWIVMKCLEKDRTRRYETVNGLAMDVNRYLKDESVQACPPSKVYQLRKFARRNKVALLITSVGLAALLTLVVGLAVSNRLITAQRNEKAEALRQKEQALALATAESDRSKKNFLAASVAIREVITKAALGSEVWAQLTPELRGRMSDEALKFYSSLLQEDSPNASLRYETGVGYRSIGLLHFTAGDLKRAEESYRKSIAILSEISAAAPGELQYRQQLAWSHRMLAGCLARGGRTQDAISAFRASAEIYARLVSEAPQSFDFRNDLAQCLLSWQRISDDVPYQQLLDGPSQLLVLRARADLLSKLGRASEAEQSYLELAAEYHKLPADRPDTSENTFQEATCEFNVAQIYSRAGRSAEAERAYLRSIDLLQKLARQFPKEFKYRLELGRSRNWLALQLSNAGRKQEAEQQHRQAIAGYIDLVKEADPLHGDWHRRELGWSHLNLGTLLSGVQRDPEAESEFRSAFALFEPLSIEKPSDASYSRWMRELCVRIAMLCKADNRREEAAKWFGKASALAGNDPAAHKEIGDLFRDAGKIDAALAEYSKIIAETPDFVGAWIGRCQCYLQKREFGKAAEDFSAVIELYEKRPAGVLRSGEMFALGSVCRKFTEQGGNHSAKAAHLALKAVPLYQAATAEYERLLSDPARWHDSWEFAIGYEQVAVALAETNQTREAEAAFRDPQRIWLKLVAADNSVDHRWHLAINCELLGKAFKQNGRLEESIESHQRALAIWEKLAAETGEQDHRNHLTWARQWLVEAFRSQGKAAEAEAVFQRAETQYREAIRQHPDAAALRMGLADVLSDQEKLDEAIAAYSEVLARKPGDQAAWKQRGACYLRKGNLARAAEYFTEAINQKPDDSWYWHERAYCYLMRGEHEKAIADHNRAIELGDNDAGQRLRRGHSFRALGQLKKAEVDYSRAVELNPQHWENWSARGELYADLGQWDKAEADLSRATELDPGQIVLLYKLALARLAIADQTGYRRTCAALLERAAAKPDPNTAYWAAWTCVLAPHAGVDPQRLVQLAGQAVASYPKRASVLVAHGAALYRAGRYEEAVQRLLESEAAFAHEPGCGTVVYPRLLLAMTHQRLDNHREAQRWLDSARQVIERPVPATKPATTQPRTPAEPWNRVVTVRSLQAEAEALPGGPHPNIEHQAPRSRREDTKPH